MHNKIVSEDFFALFCGKRLGAGNSRSVYELALDPTKVIKIEPELSKPPTANIAEWQFWQMYGFAASEVSRDVAKWLAPVHKISQNGRVLIQTRTHPVKEEDLPKSLPAFLTDMKASNFGVLDGSVVCHDFANIAIQIATNMQEVKEWRI